ncbi:MAG: polysaccharide deacetylase family protein [Deltaproteobacteria bacterium]|nr:MAG: polysaccharide deacetylase family protein [Deltaproteobacteria bacterium]
MDAIFTFHSLDKENTVLSYPPAAFRMFLDVLEEERVRVVPIRELIDRPVADGPRAVLTFDDGFRSVHTEALPLLAQRRLPAVLYVVSSWVGKDNSWPSQPATITRGPLMDWNEIREWAAAGLEVGSHSANHVPLRGTNEPRWRAEIEDSRKCIEDKVGSAVRSFAYPYGVFDDGAVARVARHYDNAVTTVMDYVRGSDPYRLPRIDTFYLRSPARHRSLFGPRARAYIRVRAWLRRLKAITVQP